MQETLFRLEDEGKPRHNYMLSCSEDLLGDIFVWLFYFL